MIEGAHGGALRSRPARTGSNPMDRPILDEVDDIVAVLYTSGLDPLVRVDIILEK